MRLVRRLGKVAALGEGSAACAPTLHRVPWHLLYNRKITENLSEANRKELGWSAPNAIRLVDLAIAGDGFVWPTGSCRPCLSRQVKGSTRRRR